MPTVPTNAFSPDHDLIAVVCSRVTLRVVKSVGGTAAQR